MIPKQTLDISFAAGLDTKTDPWRVSPENFLALENQVFTNGGRLTKRNGYEEIISGVSSVYLATLNDNLLSIGDSILPYNNASKAVATGAGDIYYSPIDLNTLPLVRNSLNQTACDTAISANGLVCTVYTELNNSTSTYKYVIADAVTGQSITQPASVPAPDVIEGSQRVFSVGNYFIIVYTDNNGGAYSLRYFCISQINQSNVGAGVIASSYVPFTTLSWDGYVVNQNLYVAYNTTSGGQAVKVTYISATTAASSGSPATANTFAAIKATHVTVTADVSNTSNPIIWINVYRSDTSIGKAMAVDQNLNTVLAATTTIPSGTVVNLASSCTVDNSGHCYLFFEVSNFYSYDANLPSNYIKKYIISQGGSVSSATTVIKGVGLASKAFSVDGGVYFWAEYLSSYQPTYFLVTAFIAFDNGDTLLSSASGPVVAAKLAYQNGNTVPISSATLGYCPVGLPSVSVLNGNQCYVSYLFKDLIAAVNKGTNVASGTQINGIYSQTGINLCKFIIGAESVVSSEIGGDLLLSGGFLWMYDGYGSCEQNFFLYPDNVEVTTATGAGSLSAQDYYYQVTYEWTDNQGNIYRSAPSIPVKQTTTTASSTNTIKVPMIRVTNKSTNSPIKIVVYRWSTAQQIYYQVTSLTAPTLNDTSVDVATITDTFSDATILGNNIIYTNGGVVENTGAPGFDSSALFDNRLWLLDAEDRNLLWFSKQVIEAVPVEMSDLFTYFVAPSSGAQQSTGDIGAIAPMDDKLIIFKTRPGIYYINGTGPDNTGSNSQYSQPVFVTTTAGCNNPASVILTPVGLMFQAVDGKGIWLLGRDLQTSYIGAPVEAYNSANVTSAVNIPNANQIRFTLDNGKTLVYDYYYQQWSTFSVSAISSCIYGGLHTFLDQYGNVYKEKPGTYLDGSRPVLLSLTTSWFKLNGIQGYQRAYFFYLLGQYISPHKLSVTIAYNYNPGITQSTLILPTNYAGVYGGPATNPGDGSDTSSPYGGDPTYGGNSTGNDNVGAVEQWRVFLDKQRCESFQINIQEIFDATKGASAGQGLNLSGILLVYGGKKPYRPISSTHSVGSNNS